MLEQKKAVIEQKKAVVELVETTIKKIIHKMWITCGKLTENENKNKKNVGNNKKTAKKIAA